VPYKVRGLVTVYTCPTDMVGYKKPIHHDLVPVGDGSSMVTDDVDSVGQCSRGAVLRKTGSD
jgi:hypothetical protein